MLETSSKLLDLKLPTLPGIALELLEAVDGDHPDIKKAAEIISADPPLSAKVLKTVNSPLYGLANKIASVNQAMVLLGANTVKNMALSFSLIANFRAKKGSSFTYSQFWKDSLIGAVAARTISTKLKKEFPDDAFFCGLLQNIGSLILAELFPKKYQSVSEVLRQNSTTIQHAEQIIFGIDHTRVGKHVIQKWGLPDFFVTPIRYHHEPDMVSTTSFKEHVLAQILYLSSLFIDIFGSNNVDSTLASINQYRINCSFASFFEPSEITQAIIKEVQSIFPIFEIEVTDSELLRISESARGHLHVLSNEMIDKISIQDQDIEQLKLHSITDGLTNLYNQRHFSKTLEHELERAKRHKTALSLIMADIDEFKAINDFFGHLAGDYALKTVAGILKRAIRGSDYIFRYGGDEFAAILPSTSSSEAQQIAERLRKLVRENPITYNDKTFMMTISFGIASLDLKSSADLERFIYKADMALYEAKNSGRDRSCFYNKADFDTSKPIILIIDDEEVVLITLSKMLERLGYRVVEASEGSKAMSLIDQYADQLDTAILDVMMPGASANDILSKLRISCNGVRVFLSSGYPSDRIEQELIRNCDGFLAKPYTLGDLSQKLLGVKHSNQRPNLTYSRTEPLTAL